jgi:hypothetical protein
MCVFARGIKHPLDVSVQRSQHSDSHVHQEIAAFGGADQATDRGLPFLKILFSLWQFQCKRRHPQA